MHPEFCFQPGRRDLFQLAAAATGLAAFGGVNLLAGAQQGASAGHSRRRLRAAFSNIGLQVSWCAQGKEAAEYWGRLFNVDVTWFDAELREGRRPASGSRSRSSSTARSSPERTPQGCCG